MQKKYIQILFISLLVLLNSCSNDTDNFNPGNKNLFFFGFPMSDINRVYTAKKGNIIKITTYFYSTSTRDYSPEVFYYTSSASGEEQNLVCGEDYVIVDENGETLNPSENGGYPMVWPNAEEGKQNINIKILSEKRGDIQILTYNPEKQLDANDVNSTTIAKTDKYEVRAFIENNHVTVRTNENLVDYGENILSYWDFDGEDPLHDLHLEGIEDDGSAIVEDPKDQNNKVMYVELPVGADRREVKWANGDWEYFFFTNKTGDLEHGDEFWIGFKVLVPTLYNPKQDNSPCIFQLGPISRTVNHVGGQGFGQIWATMHKNIFEWRQFAKEEHTLWTDTKVNLGNDELRYGEWEKFVIHCRLRSDDQGILEIWKNGTPVYTYNGANAVDGTRVVIKWGLYIGIGNSSQDLMKCYYDDIKIGNHHCEYEDVAPQ